MFPSCIAQIAFLRIASVVLVIAVAGCASRGRAPIEDRSLPRAAPQAVPSAAPEASAGPAPVEVRPQTYTVRKGDTLRAIAQDHGIDFRELAQLNNIENPDKIAVGQVLIVSRPGDLSASATGTQTMPLRSVSPVQSAEGGGASALASAAPAPTGGRNTETYKTQPKALKEPYSEHALREVQRADRRSGAGRSCAGTRRGCAAPVCNAITARADCSRTQTGCEGAHASAG
jgi:lipoprotein NlpD